MWYQINSLKFMTELNELSVDKCVSELELIKGNSPSKERLTLIVIPLCRKRDKKVKHLWLEVNTSCDLQSVWKSNRMWEKRRFERKNSLESQSVVYLYVFEATLNCQLYYMRVGLLFGTVFRIKSFVTITHFINIQSICCVFW